MKSISIYFFTISIGLDGLFGDFDSNQKLGGGILHGGYDFFFHRISFLSVEPKIGVGYFGGKVHLVLLSLQITV